MESLDGMCRRYKCLPSEMLKLGLDEIAFNIRVANVGCKAEERHMKKRESEMKQRRR